MLQHRVYNVYIYTHTHTPLRCHSTAYIYVYICAYTPPTCYSTAAPPGAATATTHRHTPHHTTPHHTTLDTCMHTRCMYIDILICMYMDISMCVCVSTTPHKVSTPCTPARLQVLFSNFGGGLHLLDIHLGLSLLLPRSLGLLLSELHLGCCRLGSLCSHIIHQIIQIIHQIIQSIHQKFRASRLLPPPWQPGLTHYGIHVRIMVYMLEGIGRAQIG